MKINRFTEEVLDEFKSRPNTHQTHFEDLVLLGKDGLEELNDKIDKFIERINGQSNGTLMVGKMDGAPAVVCWSKFEGYPDDSICLKSFLTSNKNCLTTYDDIENKYGDRPDMANKLRYCLELASCIPPGEAWQGDCLFSKNNKREVEIAGTEYLTFQPNKIVYAFSEDNPNYEKVKDADFGIYFHTIYTGDLENKSQSFDVDASRLVNVPDNIFVISPANTGIDANKNKEDFDLTEINNLYSQLKNAEEALSSDPAYESLVENKAFMDYWNTFENANLSDKQATTLNVDTFFQDLKNYIREKQDKAYNKKLDTLKTDAGKQKATDTYQRDLQEMEDLLEVNRDVLVKLVKCLNLAATIKMVLWAGLKKAKQIYNSFYLHREKGYIPASIEGVSYNDADGNIVKIVDRSSFSNVNRDTNYLSGFEHESLDMNEDTVKTKDGKWTNKGKEGTHGKFKTKKAADAQRKAIWANWNK